MPDPRWRQTVLGLGAVLLALVTIEVRGQPADATAPAVVDLGGGRYGIGSIVVDKSQRFFTVTGRVLRIEPPLEYLAVTVGGAKGYESLLELDADALQFNLACILIGLTTDGVVPPDYQFDLDEVVGPQVRILAERQDGDDTIEVDAGQLIVDQGQPGVSGDWVYFGSTYFPEHPNPFFANQTGTLIGFVHDPASIIEHRTGLGVGRYGSIAGNADLLGAVGTALTLRIEAVELTETPLPGRSSRAE
jgi:hypothetical protein